jgi:hypothetical protein
MQLSPLYFVAAKIVVGAGLAIFLVCMWVVDVRFWMKTFTSKRKPDGN